MIEKIRKNDRKEGGILKIHRLDIVDGGAENHRQRALKKGFPLWEGLSYNGQQV